MNDNFLKLTSNAYKLSEYFPESDPLKSKAKEKILLIMEQLMVITQSIKSDFLENYPLALKQKEILNNIEVLLGYFEIAKNQEWISSINYLIISNEYKKIKEKIKESSVNAVKQEVGQEASSAPVEKIITEKDKNNSQNLSERQQKIIAFLKENQKAQVMDLQTILPDITKRTIRRDLDDLLITGKIIRMGEFNRIFYKVN